jgi:osmotically-inducible protein OsmY
VRFAAGSERTESEIARAVVAALKWHALVPSQGIGVAFRRGATIDAGRISVAARDGQVIVAGGVRSSAERQEAERDTWAAPGVILVDDRLRVVP